MKKLSFLLIMIFFLLEFMVPVEALNSIDFSLKGSIEVTLKDNEDELGISGAEITIYQVATASEENHNLVYTYTDQFSDCEVSLDDFSKVDFDKDIKECLSDDALGTVGSTDDNGVVYFNNLEFGLYLIVQTNKVEGYSVIDSFLVQVPLWENNDWIYNIKSLPKTEIYKTIDLTVIKKWNSNGSKIPKNIEVALYKEEELIDTVILSQENKWTYIWEDIQKSDQYKVIEVRVPKNYVATYEQEGYVFTITNTDKLVQTGQPYYPIIILIVMGIIFTTVGVVQYKLNKYE